MREHIAILLFLLISLSPIGHLQAQDTAARKAIVQLSGIITNENSTPIPYTWVSIKNTKRMVYAGLDGFYTMPVSEKDTIEYAALGFKKAYFIVPSGVIDHKVTHNVRLAVDTIVIPPILAYPLPSAEDFRYAFLNLNLDDEAYSQARANLDQDKLMELYKSLQKDGPEQQTYVLQQMAASFYYAGGQANYANINGNMIPTSLLSPFAWAAFIKTIQDGSLFRKAE